MKKLLFLSVIILVCVFAVVYFISKWNANQSQESAVIQQIRTLNRWETASYTVQQVIDSGSTGNIFQQFLFGNRILLVAQGTVIAGFDLANLSDNNIHINGKNIAIKMTSPEILSTSLNESQTRVYDRQKGLLVPENNNLESEARISAIDKIRQAACSEGILETASDNAKKQLNTMLQAVGYTTVTVTIPQRHC